MATKDTKKVQEIKAGKICWQKDNKNPQIESFLYKIKNRNGVVFALIGIDEKEKNFNSILAVVEQMLIELAEKLEIKSNLEHRFEKLLQELNEEIADLFETGHIDFDPAALNAIIGAAAEQKLIVTGTGEIITSFLHKTEKQRYRVFDLFAGIKAEAVIPEKNKLFSIVLDGDLHPGDTLLISNKPLYRYIETEELNQIMATLPPASAVERIKQYLPELKNFGFLIMKSDLGKKGQLEKAEAIKPAGSIESLAKTRNQTEEILETQKPKLGNFFSHYKNKVTKSVSGSKILKKDRLAKLALRVLKIAIAAIIITVTFIYNLIKTGSKYLWRLSKKQERQKAKKELTESWHQTVDSMTNRFNILPKTSKYLLISVLILAFIFTNSLYLMGRKQKQEENVEAFQSTIDLVKQKQDAAEASLIYGNESQARTLLSQAGGLLDTLPTDSPERIQKIDSLRDELANSLNELRHMVTIGEPLLLADFAAENKQGIGILAHDGNIYVFTGDNSVYTLNQTEKTIVSAASTNQLDGSITSATTGENAVYFVDDRPGVSYYVLESNTINDLTINTTGADNSPQDMAIYGSKLYLLSPENNQIYKHSASGDGFGAGSPWINNRQADLTDAVSITIDGYVYVLKSSGEVVQYLSGDEQVWQKDSIDPALTSPTKIWTDIDSEYLYILEPSGNRLVVLNKEGGLVVQYYSDQFGSLQDFLVSEADKKMYLLTNDKVFGVAATHLQ